MSELFGGEFADFSYMKDFLDSLTCDGIPGNAVVVTIYGKEAFRYSSGYADIENKIPFTPDSTVFMYSASKPVTVTSAMLLYEKGKLSLDAHLCDYIPEFNPDIKIRHLLNMTAGLTYNTQTENIKNVIAANDGNPTTLDVVRAIAKDGITFEAGKTWQYSLCHDVLACVVELVSGQRFCDYVKENIFTPCGMTQSLYHPTDEQIDTMARQYVYKLTEEKDLVELQKNGGRGLGKVEFAGMNNSLVFGKNYDSGGAGIVSTVADYVKFATALANGRLLQKETLDLMRTNTLTSAQLTDFSWSQHKGYGYGLGVRTKLDGDGNTDYNADFGWSGAAGATVLVNPTKHIGLAYAHHMLNPWEDYYLPRLCEALYKCT